MPNAWKCLAFACSVLPMAAAAKGVLENPPPGSTMSGIGLVSGWNCDAQRIELSLDGDTRILVPSGTSRLDTAGACGGKTATGFGYLVGWALGGPGTHTLVAYGDGVEFARSTFTVMSYGAFLSGLKRTVRVDHFPFYGQAVMLDWNESSQSFVATQLRNDAPALGGTWYGTDLERRSACTHPENDGNHGTSARFDVTFGGSSWHIVQTSINTPPTNCDYAGTYDPNTLVMTGSFTCTDGKTGTLASNDLLVTAREMSIQATLKLTGSESCTIDATLGGSRY